MQGGGGGGDGGVRTPSQPQLRSSLVFHFHVTLKMTATSGFHDSSRIHQIRFRPGLHPDPVGGAYSAPPEPLAGLRGPYF